MQNERDVPQEVRVTVAIISHDHGPYIEQSIESILDQSIHCKLIIIDDYSADDTQPRIRRVLTKRRMSPDISLLLQQENRGLPANLNTALTLTDTEYFVYLSGDDWSVPDRLRKQVEAMDRAGPATGLCYTDCRRAREDGSFHDELFSQNHSHVFRPHSETPYRDLLLLDNWIPAPTVMFRTSALRQVGGFDERIRYEDHDSYVRIARDFDLLYLDEPLSVHRELDRGLGVEIFQPHSLDWLEGQIRLEHKQLGHDPLLDRQLANRLRVRAIKLFKMGGNRRLVTSVLGDVIRTRLTFDPALWFYWLSAAIGARNGTTDAHPPGSQVKA